MVPSLVLLNVISVDTDEAIVIELRVDAFASSLCMVVHMCVRLHIDGWLDVITSFV